ncbi:related to ketopantoate reductase [Phialocephala subalpina]|uniref:Related to ketopantoate reductase n=1 Tax=Phialocephala subalpina TaxID=576137 RepID=A0A1L7XT07_9HELO|nr:related to ketopantoate reductase [Phialocephala subalpina]
MAAAKANILVVGFGGTDRVTVYNLEASGRASVTGVLRSNYQIDGNLRAVKPLLALHKHKTNRRPVHQAVPEVSNDTKPFDYIVVTTKNIPDIPPTVVDIIHPAVTPGHSVIVLIQNGVKIENPLISAFSNVVISCISRMSSAELSHGEIFHQDHDTLLIGPLDNLNIPSSTSLSAAKQFVDLYNAAGRATCVLEEDVAFIRWRKLVYNVSFNSLCAITSRDTSKLRLADFPVEELLRSVQKEIIAIAKAAGVNLPENQDEVALGADLIDAYFRPSMQQDIETDNYIEMEIIVGALLREAKRLGVLALTLNFVYSVLKTLQMRTQYKKGRVALPAMKDYGASNAALPK